MAWGIGSIGGESKPRLVIVTEGVFEGEAT